MDFRGKVAVVVGDAAGVGRSTVAALARLGADVVFADTDPQRLESTHGRVARTRHRILSVRCNVAVAEEVDRLAAQTLALMGRVDILINNAGVMAGGPCEIITEDGVEVILHLGVTSALRPIKAFVPHMIGREDCHVVITSSVAGRFSDGHAYVRSNLALAGLSEKLCEILSSRGIGLTVLSHSLALPKNGGPNQLHVADPDEVAGMVIDAIRLDELMIETESTDDILSRVLGMQRWPDPDELPKIDLRQLKREGRKSRKVR